MERRKSPTPRWWGRRLAATTQQGASGLEASVIGFVLVGSILAGYLAGAWLDTHFKTSFWMPLLVLVGIFGGFREMFRTIGTINARSAQLKADKAAAHVKREAPRTATGQAMPGGSGQSVEPERGKPRIFNVPPPPEPSYLKTSGATASRDDAASSEQTTDELIAKLLNAKAEDKSEKLEDEKLEDDQPASP